MGYLRRLKTKLQFSHQNSKNDRLFLDGNAVNGNTRGLTHSQWAHVILGSMIVGTILGYGQYYPVLNQMRYIFAIGLAIIVVGIFKALQSFNALQSSHRWHSLSKLIVLVFILVGLSYYQTDLRIVNFNSYTSYYLHQEGEYLGTVVEAPEKVNLNGQEYYKYTIEESADSLLKLHFKPRLKNTLLVTGEAEVDARSGKISTIQLTGEYDMIFYRLSIQMGNHGVQSLTPQNCSLTSRFLFFGNDVRTHYTIAYHLPKILPNISEANQNFQLMEQIRPEPLTSYERMVYRELVKDKRSEEKDTTALDSVATPAKVNFVKSVLWDMIGENIFNDIHQDFGPNKAGSLRIDPILNPLYMEYSPSQGFYYNFNIRGGYHFSENSNIWLQLKGGYSFRLHQFSFWIPLIYYFDIRHNGFISSGISGGRRIQNGNLVNELRIATII